MIAAKEMSVLSARTGTHGDALELFELAEEVLDEMTPFELENFRLAKKRLTSAQRWPNFEEILKNEWTW